MLNCLQRSYKVAAAKKTPNPVDVHVGSRVRATVQLVDAAADELVWSETHDASFTDVLGIRDVAAKQIADDILNAIGSIRTPGSAAR